MEMGRRVEWWRGEGGCGRRIEGQKKMIVGIMTISNSFNNSSVGNI